MSAVATGAEAEPTLPAGLLVEGRYELRTRIGAGPLGAVYQAFDRDVEVEVALKLLDAPLLTDDVTSRAFLETLRRVVRLVHPALIKVFDVGLVTRLEGGEVPAGVNRPGAFVSMQLLAGLPLSRLLEVRLLRQSRFEPAEAGGVLGEAGVALAASQPIGPHGRLKPGNLVVLEQGLKLIDLGQGTGLPGPSRAAAAAADPDAVYLSPELRQGAPLSPESDTYSLGVLALVLLTGHRPALDATVASPEVKGALSSLPPAVMALLEQALEVEAQKRPPPVAFLVDLLEQLDPARAERLRVSTAQLRAVERRFREASGPIKEPTFTGPQPRRPLGIAAREVRPVTGSVTAPGVPEGSTPTGPPRTPAPRPVRPLPEDDGATQVAAPPELAEESDSSGDLLGGSALSRAADPAALLESTFEIESSHDVESPEVEAEAHEVESSFEVDRGGVDSGVESSVKLVPAGPLDSPTDKLVPGVPPTAVQPAVGGAGALAELSLALATQKSVPAVESDPELAVRDALRSSPDSAGASAPPATPASEATLEDGEPIPDLALAAAAEGAVGPSGRVASTWPTVESDGKGLLPPAPPLASPASQPLPVVLDLPASMMDPPPGPAEPPPRIAQPVAVAAPVSTAEMAAVVGVALPQAPRKRQGGVPFVVIAVLVFVISLAIGAGVKMRMASIGPQVERPAETAAPSSPDAGPAAPPAPLVAPGGDGGPAR